ncbi:hypothetical protein CLV58_12532 [Spirosoma oryzae]|uniref:Uncharacterized protein n=1 Tax=Spirosoma oryzae TaxID=1469603 RepID=A0A2T0S8L8_9BACT|nr:hypothetical protein CLV58_12532 [Spirosoma oryzae]
MDPSFNTCLPSSPCPGRRIWSVDDIRRADRDAGRYYFSRNTMRAFRSRVGDKIHIGPGGIYFVTSEQREWNTERRYTVRQFNMATCGVDTVGEFMQYDTNPQAHRAAARFARF